ncbi:Ig-like domain-containing protein, partial [Bradyrhizobium neotropicale]|uniref:Ig-like domain-containing protein n=1 Tax=Bradyrhizobium neotropicale TaxID=1497615 RepID=UPI0011AB5CBE
MSNDGVISIVGNQNASVIDGNSSVIVAGNGNDSLTAGAGSIVTAGNGADTISVGAGSVVVAGTGNDTVTAGSNSLVTAGNGSDHVTAGANSVIVVGNGNDTLSVGNNSIVTAGNGNDQVTVGANSVIVVGNGNDTLTAGANSVITAGNGNDTIHLGQNDLVVVGTGKDTFVLPSSAQLALTAPTSLSVNEDGTVALALGIASSGFGFGKETIVGFNTSKDVIQLSTAQFANFAAVMASAKQIGNDTIITGDASDTIDLSGVRLSSLTASDFSFVSSTSNISVTISGIPAGVTLSDTAGAITVVNGSATLTQAQLAGLTLKAGEVTAGTLTVTATDTSTGNFVTKTIALTVNPVAPTLGGPTSLTVGSGATIALGITETPFDSRDTISLTIKGVPSDALLSAGTKNADGSWALTPAQLTGLTLKAGGATSASLTVTATNTAGITASVTETIQLNVTAPLKVTFDTVSFTDTGAQGDHITNNGNVTLSGTVTDNLTVSQVQVFNGNTLLGSATVDNVHHTWSLVTTLVNGNYNQLNVQATDSAGTSVSASTTQYFQVDTTAPTLVSDSESVSGLTQSKVESITILASDANGVASVAIYDDATHKLLGNATLNGGAWKYGATDLSDGVHKFYAVITDVAGNQTTTADLTTVTVDTTPPTLISDSESAPGLTKSNVETITVNATDANGVASVTIYEEGKAQPLGAATLSSGTPSSGTWSFSTGSLGDGAHNFYAVIVDTAGNQTKTADLATVTVDTTPPALISDSESVSGLTQSTTDVITVSASDINGVASVAIYEEGKAQPLGSATLSAGSAGNGTWTYNATGLGDGAHAYYAVITDAAGNQTKTTDLATVTVDTTAPVATIAISASGATNTTTETITVNASDADGVASVEIDDNGAFLANATQGSPGVWTYTAANLTEGGHDFTAFVKDAATNSTTTGHATVVVDTTAPSVTFDTVSYDHTGTAGFTKDGTVTLSGTTGDNVTVSQVQVFSGAQLLGDAAVDNTSHTWTLTQNLPAGVYSNLSVTATDEAGNTGTAANTDATQTLQVDHTPPSIAFGTVSYVDTGVANDGITGNNLVTMSGAVADDVTVSQVQVFSGSQLLGNAVIDNTSHSWTLTSNLADGTYANLSATATDEAGNSTSAANTSATTSFQIDTAAPIITFTSVTLAHPTDSSGTNSSDGGIILSGAVSDNVSVTQVQVFNGSQLLGTATVSNGTWALDTTLAQGSYNNLHATATDEAGNVADAGNSHVVTVSPASGYVIDGYITGATVFADTNGNGKLDAGEASGITDESGHFTLGAGTTTGTLVLVGGTDTATGLAFTGVMTAPTGSTQVTPLTTLVQSVAAAKGGDVAAASQSVAKALGLDPTVNLTNLDTVAAAYAGDSSAFVAASKVLNTVSMVASAVVGTGASDFSSAAASAFSALAAQIATTSAPLDLSSTDLVSTVVSSTIASASSGTSSLTSDQTAAIASVVTSVNVATDKAAAANSGTGTTATAALLTSVSATSIVAQGTTSTQLQQATSGVTDLTTLANNTTAASVTSDASQQHVGSVAPAAPTFVSLTPTDGSPNNFTMVHYTLTFSDPVTGVSASDFSIATTGLVGASIAGITPVAGSNGTQYTISVNTGVGVGDGTLTLSFTGSTVQDIAGNAFKDQSTHTGATYIVDQDTGEQAALGLNVTNTNVNTAGSAIFSFTVAGLEPNDTGTVTFTDGANKVSVAVSGGQTSYTANLGTLTDGPITSSLAVNTDAAGNSFTPVAGTSAVTLSGFNVAGSSIQIIQNGAGDITVIPSGSVTTQSGNGVTAEESASGTGNVTVNATGSVTGQGTGSIGLLAENLNAANAGNINVTSTGGASGAFDGIDVVNKGNGNISVEAGGAVAATVQFGIRTEQYGSGSTSVVMDPGSTIHSGGAGISLVNFATSIGTGANSVITVTNNATINSGTTLNPSGSQPQGIAAGYYGTTGGPGTVGIANTNVNGTVTVNNNGNITAAAGYGINAYNYGNGNVTVNEAAGTSVSGAQYGIGAFGNSKGTGSVAVNVGANATISGGSIFGIQAFVNGVGSVSVTTSAGDNVTGGSSGINAQNQSATDDPTSSVTVIAHGTIHSGTLLTPNGSTPGGIVAGYSPGGQNVANGAVAGNVLVQSDATIVAAAGSGINAYNYGAGNVTVTTG